MAVTTSNILDVLNQYGIHPLEDNWEWKEFPEVGDIEPDEEVYPTTLDDVFNGDSPIDVNEGASLEGDTRLNEWWLIIRDIIEGQKHTEVRSSSRREIELDGRPPEP
jgi:hypothetical protein